MVQELQEYQVENALDFTPVEVELDEWSNLPLLLPKYLLKNQKSLQAIIEYTKERCEDETTQSLRAYIVTELEKVTNNTI